eukprot:COSAG02_NODE_4385_length_5421_cov_4.928035_11_plen_99_part_00
MYYTAQLARVAMYYTAQPASSLSASADTAGHIRRMYTSGDAIAVHRAATADERRCLLRAECDRMVLFSDTGRGRQAEHTEPRRRGSRLGQVYTIEKWD